MTPATSATPTPAFAENEAARDGIVATRSELVALGRRIGATRDVGSGRRVATRLAGPHASRLHGPGMEFSEVRAYQAGDDIRSIDWRVTARTGRAHSKLFEAERERPVWFVVDVAPTMHFATRGVYKSVAAARAAALMAWEAHGAGERIGGVVTTAGRIRECPLGRTRRNLFRFFDALAAATAEQELPLGGDGAATSAPGNGDGPAGEGLLRPLSVRLDLLRRRVRAGSRVVVISDFYDLDDAALRQLRYFARACELVLVHVHDPLEGDPPPPGQYRVHDGRSVHTLVARGSDEWRRAYRSPFEQRVNRLRELRVRDGAQALALRTDGAIEDVLPARSAARVSRPGPSRNGRPASLARSV